MVGQLDRLLAATGLLRVTLGIVPATAEISFASTNFSMLDQKIALVEAITAELTVTSMVANEVFAISTEPQVVR